MNKFKNDLIKIFKEEIMKNIFYLCFLPKGMMK